VASGPLWLLIGNSRWHWAEAIPAPVADPHQPDGPSDGQGLRFWDTPPPKNPVDLPWERLRAWAAVGPIPPGPLQDRLQPAGPSGRRLGLEGVPLGRLPPWLGVDRALVGWQAWRRQRHQGGGAVLVADAGTALSLTRVGAGGGFAGGRIQPGLRVQLEALGRATALLPLVEAEQQETLGGSRAAGGGERWPVATEQAMRLGCLLGLAASVAEAWRELQRQEPTGLWLTGGDAGALAPLLEERSVPFQAVPGLAMEALVALGSARVPLSSDPGP
jgi:type III pantothenate kinase